MLGDEAPDVGALCHTPAVAVDMVRLRQLVEKAVRALDFHTHRVLDELCPQLGLPPLPPDGSKHQRLEACLASLADEDLVHTALRLLGEDLVSLGLVDRFAIEDVLAEAGPVVEIPGRLRREIAEALDLETLVYRADRFERLLERLWVLDDPLTLWTGASSSLRAQIDQHVFRNLGTNWDTEDLFEHLGAFEAGHWRFGRFLEGLVAADTIPNAPTQQRIVETINLLLKEAGARLEQTDLRDGYPHFQLVRTGHGASRRPKQLLFASSTKPDVRFLSMVDNDIEVLQDSGEVLHYDRPIGPEGLRWCDLQRWWQATTATDDEDTAKATLYKRLLACLPDEQASPQIHLFRLYHQIHGPHIPRLPALLPEVWLRWDHKTVPQRGPDALIRHRVDFLLLMPGGLRVILEVDGRHHYADAKAYAETVAADRELRLRGYEVFRFGSTELSDEHRARPLLQRFFAELFDRYGVAPVPGA